eukprot:TRINITY_DN920_c0_g1_i2.p2 TRINITY_DN920_c0_g1~~TRINITY_DN920_c0_g1_i2.p2  ORF type:complete len:575 (+),score=97.17 TRINITY_DN920_c0_g1_i2:257-1981(+)
MTTVKNARPAPKDSAEPPLKKMRVSELLGITTGHVAPPDDQRTWLTASGTWAAAEAISKSMPKGDGIPLTLLTGFLGAGKSTVLNFILKADHGLKIAVLINEFGLVDIDNQLVDTVAKGEEGEPIMLNNGCVCCTISNGFIEAVHAILDRADQSGRLPDYFIVETTGLANPKPIMDSIEATELSQDLYLDQVLTVVDSSAWSEDHYGSETAHRQIQAADTVLLSKTDLADDARIKKVVASILSIRPNARILRSQKGHVPIAALFDLGIPFSAKPKRRKEVKSVENGKVKNEENAGGTQNGKHDHDPEHKHEHKEDHKHEHKNDDKHDHEHDHKKDDKHGHKHNHKHEHEHGHDDHEHDADGKCIPKPGMTHLEEEGFTSISFVSEYPFSLRRFREEFMEALPRGVFRSKGLLWFSNYDSRFVFHWSGSRYNVDEQMWPEGMERKNQLVLIGRELDKPLITKMLENCIAKPGEESEDEFEGEYGEEEGVEGALGDEGATEIDGGMAGGMVEGMQLPLASDSAIGGMAGGVAGGMVEGVQLPLQTEGRMPANVASGGSGATASAPSEPGVAPLRSM